MYWRDSPEFTDVAYTLGISHPAGSPVYSTISKFFTFLPFSSISFKINLVSLFFAVLTVVFTCKVVQILLSHYYPTIKKNETNLIKILCTLLLTIMPSFWLKAIVAEVYTMNVFFLILSLYFLLKWSIRNDFRYVLLAAFIYGLSSGVHAGVILFFPGFLLFFFLAQTNDADSIASVFNKYGPLKTSQYNGAVTFFMLQRAKLKGCLKSFVLVSFFLLLGFSAYLFLPIRSIANPEFDWGNPETFNNFFSHILNRGGSSSYFNNITHFSSFLRDSFAFIKITIDEITLVGMLLLILGITAHIKKDWKGFLLLFLIALVNTLFYLTTTFTDYDSKSGTLFIPAFTIFIVWIGLGIYFLINIWLKMLPKLNFKRLTVPIILVFIFFSFSMNYRKIEKSNYYLAESAVKEMYIDNDHGSILFSSHYWFQYRYFQDVANLRPDLIIIHIRDITNPETFNVVTEERYPMLEFPNMESARDSFFKFWPLLIKENINRRNIYTDLDSIILKENIFPFVPYKKFLMRIIDKDKVNDIKEVTRNYFRELQISIDNDISQEAYFHDQEEGIKTYYNIFLLNFANYLRLKINCNEALSFLKMVENLTDERSKNIPMLKGICLAELGKYDESTLILINLLTEYPDDKFILTNLGNLYFKIKDYKKSEKYLKKVIEIDEYLPKAHFALGMVYSAENRIDEGVIEIRKAINLTKSPLEKEKMEIYLKNIIKKNG